MLDVIGDATPFAGDLPSFCPSVHELPNEASLFVGQYNAIGKDAVTDSILTRVWPSLVHIFAVPGKMLVDQHTSDIAPTC